MRCALFGLVLAGLAVDGAPGRPPVLAQTRTTIVRHFTPADQRSGRYQYVPFDVPPGTGTLRIGYQYDRGNGDHVIDIGLFEPGSLELGTAAFRGYSGGARQAILISPQETTPGYRPGPLPAGQWHVLLGLYKVGERGVDVTIYVDVEDGPAPRAPAELPRRRPSAPPPTPSDRDVSNDRWYTGALHTHTLHSDGTVTPAAMLEQFRNARFDFVAITDHNNTTHQHELATARDGTAPLWIIGEEVTTPGGHASVWGLDPGAWVDFRIGAKDHRIADLIAAARRAGGVFSVNHPASACAGCGWSHDFADGIEAIEVSNGRHGEVAAALALWDRLLGSGRRITAVGSSDWHSAPNRIDDANVRVRAAALTESAILDAIRQGHVIVMRNARDAAPEIVVRSDRRMARVGDALVLEPAARLRVEITAPGHVGSQAVVLLNGTEAATATLDLLGEARVEVAGAPGYLRVELRAPDRTPQAIANPIYLVRE